MAATVEHCQMSRPGGLPRGSAGQPAPPNV